MIAPETPTMCATSPWLFDDDHGVRTEARITMLRRICTNCPVFTDCRAAAISTPVSQLGGFVAGMTERDRKAIQKANRRKGRNAA